MENDKLYLLINNIVSFLIHNMEDDLRMRIVKKDWKTLIAEKSLYSHKEQIIYIESLLREEIKMMVG